MEISEEVLDKGNLFSGTNSVHSPKEIFFREGMENRIKSLIKTGIDKKEQKESLLAAIPMKGQINLEGLRP